MPYIEESLRASAIIRPVNVGELSYCISTIITNYLKSTNPNHFHNFNEVIGVLETLKLEIYRRLVTKYEDKKMAENGDVFD